MVNKERVKWGDVWREYQGTSLDFYNEHCSDLSRGQLQEVDEGLYNRLRRDDYIDQVPLFCDMNELIIKEYNDNYGGARRGELQEINKNLYDKMWRRGIIKNVPLERD